MTLDFYIMAFTIVIIWVLLVGYYAGKQAERTDRKIPFEIGLMIAWLVPVILAIGLLVITKGN